ncbi:MAG TPA: hypothetical protein PKZ27_12045 [Rhodocyclaceae bacterium]|jgi:hypothetical protein|nr:hypothetical protein [Rhodocyclaceae bacterium]
MTAETQNGTLDDASLDRQIRVVEQRLMRHRASSSLRLATFRRQLRDRMTSPLVLLMATGIGFAMGQSRRATPVRSSPEAPPGAGGIQLLSTMLSMVSLTGSVMTLIQRFKADKTQSPQKNTPA